MSTVDFERRFAVLSKSAVAIAILSALAFGLAAQEKPQDKKKEWKDRAEWEIYETIVKTSDSKAWLENLDKWTKQYPQTDYADDRRQMYLETYRTMDRPREAFNAAIEVLKDNPNNLVALSAIVGYVFRLTPPNPADLETAEMAASAIVRNLDVVYSKENRPPQMTDDAAGKAKAGLRVFAQKTLGWIAYTRKDWVKAEAELNKTLDLDPNQGQVSYWLGVAILGEAKTEKQQLALYHFARAAAYDGPGSMSASDRQQVQTYLNSVYKKYHGSVDGLDQLLASAKTAAIPSTDLVIKSSVQMEKEKIEADEAAARANPMLALWRRIKSELLRDGGPAYFDTSMKGAALPAGVDGVTKFKGKLVSTAPAVRPKELVLAIEGSSGGEVTLKLDAALPGKMEPGGEIEFEGVASAYTKDPFMVTFEVEKAKIAGWTGKNETQKKNTGSKKSTTSKKSS